MAGGRLQGLAAPSPGLCDEYIVAVLWAAFIPPFNCVQHGYNVVMEASRSNKVAVMEYLVDVCGCDATAASEDGRTALTCALVHGTPLVAHWLIQRFPAMDVNARVRDVGLHRSVSCLHDVMQLDDAWESGCTE